jgi:hypothetical protein
MLLEPNDAGGEFLIVEVGFGGALPRLWRRCFWRTEAGDAFDQPAKPLHGEVVVAMRNGIIVRPDRKRDHPCRAGRFDHDRRFGEQEQ